jgi:eukaryotic-like serine/threonine-protein kinase
MNKIADYALLQWLWKGNHGEFYLAQPPARLGLNVEHVIVKVITGVTSDDGFRRASRELRVFASVQSRYLVSLLDAGQDGPTFFYSMEHLPMGSLDVPGAPLQETDRLRALAHAARGVHALHEAGIAHRDIRPANIMLHRGGAKLADLGLASVLVPGLTVTGMGLIGSVEYVDPAVIRGERVSRASDIWSLGAVAHRVLAGSGIYGGLPTDDPLLALRRVLSAPPALAPSLPLGQKDIIEACLSPEPAGRPPTALVVAERLEELETACEGVRP